MIYSSEEKSTPSAAPHRLILEDRQRLSLTGITEVESFDDTAVILHTDQGTLIIRGEGLHLRSLEGGQVFVDGSVNALVYAAARSGSTGRNFFSRLFG